MPLSEDENRIVAEGLAALDRLAAGEAPTVARLAPAAAAMGLIRDLHRDAGLRDKAAQAAADRARLIWQAAGAEGGPQAGFTPDRALAEAQEAQAAAISAAESSGITKENLSAYVLGLRIAGLAALALGQEAGAAGRDRLAEAAAAFGEAAAGYRRLDRQGEAQWAELKAVEARGLLARRD